jgi:hypothetical protein
MPTHFLLYFKKKIVMNSDETNPGVKNLKEKFKLDEDDECPYKTAGCWGARIVYNDYENCR